jgi:NADH-quinone oxidoreductase subunit J
MGAIDITLLVLLVALACLAVFLRDLLRAAISLAFMSALLAVVVYRMDSPYAAVFELSVVAGLITVLFVSAIAMTKDEEQVPEARWPLYVFPLVLALFGVLDILVMKSLFAATPAGYGNPTTNFGGTLWGLRSLDIVGQIAVIFAGVFGVLALFRSRPPTAKEQLEAERAKEGGNRLW